MIKWKFGQITLRFGGNDAHALDALGNAFSLPQSKDDVKEQYYRLFPMPWMDCSPPSLSVDEEEEDEEEQQQQPEEKTDGGAGVVAIIYPNEFSSSSTSALSASQSNDGGDTASLSSSDDALRPFFSYFGEFHHPSLCSLFANPYCF